MKEKVKKKKPEDNIAIQLLEQFDEESDGDGVTLEEPKPQKHKWGPVVAPRVSTRIKRDGRNAIQKAGDLRRLKDLEVPKGNKNHNSFSAFNDEELLLKARKAGLKLGDNDGIISQNIQVMRQVEDSRLSAFKDTHPECFLPANLDLNLDEIRVEMSEKSAPGCDLSRDHPEGAPTWAKVVSGRKSSCRKLEFINGSKPILEC